MGVQSNLCPAAARGTGLQGWSAAVALPHTYSVQAGREGSALAWDAAGREGCWVCWGLLNGRVAVQGGPGHPTGRKQGGDGVSR